MIIQKFQHLQEESCTDYSLPKADQEDVVRSVKSQSVASQVGTKDFGTSSIRQAKMVGLNIKNVVKSKDKTTYQHFIK